jgi:hypothetical protein
VSVLLLACSGGAKKAPFIVFKEAPSKVPERQVENDASRHGFGPRVWGELEGLEGSNAIFANKTGVAYRDSHCSVARDDVRH